jgi:hypothetical protein
MSAQTTPGPVDFDLTRGRVERRSSAPGKGAHPEQVLLVPLSVVASLEKSAGLELTKQFARSVGVSFGRRVATSLGSADAVAGATIEAIVAALASEVAVSGWGALHLERWGRAMLLVIEHAPPLPAGALAALLEGAIEAAAAREVHGVALGGDSAAVGEGGRARVLILSAKAAVEARRLLATGSSEGDLLARLHAAAGGAS